MLELSESDPGYLFGEGAGRFIIEVDPKDSGRISAIANTKKIGTVTNDLRISISREENILVDISVADARKTWKAPFWDIMG